MKYFLSLFLCFFIVNLHGAPPKEVKHIKANDKLIEYIARTEVGSNGDVSFDWTGSHIRMHFTGGFLSVKLSDTHHNYYDLFLDGKYNKTIEVNSVDSTIVLAHGISKKMHTMELYKRTEGFQGITTVHGFYLAEYGCLCANPNPITRKILYVGDSLTCGFGSESNDRKDVFLPSEENSYKSYASIISRYYNADYHLIAHSGEGVVKNYDDSTPTSKYTILQRIYTTYDMRKDLMWDHSRFSPDLLVVNIGSNDFAKKDVHPSEQVFIDGYVSLIESLRSIHNDVPIICMCDQNEVVNDLIKRSLKQLNFDDVLFVYTTNDMLNNDYDLGASFHPNYEGHKKMAMSVIPYISSIMNWSIECKIIE